MLNSIQHLDSKRRKETHVDDSIRATPTLWLTDTSAVRAKTCGLRAEEVA